jgi:hypothetical protein
MPPLSKEEQDFVLVIHLHLRNQLKAYSRLVHEPQEQPTNPLRLHPIAPLGMAIGHDKVALHRKVLQVLLADLTIESDELWQSVIGFGCQPPSDGWMLTYRGTYVDARGVYVLVVYVRVMLDWPPLLLDEAPLLRKSIDKYGYSEVVSPRVRCIASNSQHLKDGPLSRPPDYRLLLVPEPGVGKATSIAIYFVLQGDDVLRVSVEKLPRIKAACLQSGWDPARVALFKVNKPEGSSLVLIYNVEFEKD